MSGDKVADGSGSPSSLDADRRTGTAAQEERVLAALRLGPQSTDDLRTLGIYQAPARVLSLRRKGYTIHTERFAGVARDGYHHVGMGCYVLVGEPGAK